MDQKQTKQIGRMVVGIIAAVAFFACIVLMLMWEPFVGNIVTCLMMVVAMVLLALGKTKVAGVLTIVSCVGQLIELIFTFSHGRNYEDFVAITTLGVCAGLAFAGVAMLKPRLKGLAWILPGIALICKIVANTTYEYHYWWGENVWDDGLERWYHLMDGHIFGKYSFWIFIGAACMVALACTLSRVEETKAAAPNRQMPMAGQVATGVTSTMDGIQQPNTQPVAYDQYTGRPIYGYDQYTGRPIYGYDQYGRTIYGFDQNGYPIIGFDPNGYPIYGYDQYGQPIYDPTAPVGASETWNETARKNAEEDLEKIKLKKYKSGLLRLIILNIFTLGIYKLYWIFKTTKFINQYDTLSAKRDPGMNVILCACVPFYAAYWMFKTITSLESMADEGVGTTSAAQMVAVFDIVAPLATWMYAQDRINMLIDGQLERQLVDFTKCKGSPVWAFLLSFFTGGLLGFFWTLKVAKAIEETAEFTLSPFMWALLGVIFPPANMFFALKVGKVLDSRSTRKCAHIAIASAMVPSLHMAILQERINLD